MILSYDLYKLQELLMNFNVLTGLRSVIFGMDKKIIARYPEHNCEFCRLLKENPLIFQKCQKSDAIAIINSQKTKHSSIYECHAGLTEIIVPIYISNSFIGYLMLTGVLLNKQANEYWLEVKDRYKESGVSESILKKAFFQLEAVNMEQIQAAAQILEACVSYIWQTGLILMQENSLPRRISEYITSHLDDDLSVGSLCRNFGIDKSKFYRTSRSFFGLSINQIIKNERMKKAIDLLMNSSLNINEISCIVGFPDYNYFIKVFKANYGITPLQYRKQQYIQQNL